MLAVQSQEFWGGRWALAARTRGEPTLRDVDAAFASGDLVRAWTMRGTLHIIPARDLAWVLQITGPRQRQQATSRQRDLGLDDEIVGTAERALRGALRGSGLTRAEAFEVLQGCGIDPRNQRGIHILSALTFNGVLCQGPVVERAGGVSREQLFVLTEEFIGESAKPADPLAELVRRYVAGHAPASVEDFAWWSGLTLGTAREAAARAASSLDDLGNGCFAPVDRPRRSTFAPAVVALGPFDEYYISYADRSVVCAPEHQPAVGPGKNGMVSPILLADGRVVGTWRHSTAVGKHADAPHCTLFDEDAVPPEDVTAALARYARFIRG